MFPFSEVSSLFSVNYFCLTPLDESGTILLFCLCIFRWISSISRSENQPFLIIVLTLTCLKIRTFLPDLNHSFLVSPLWGVAPKISVKCKLIVFFSPYFAFRSLMVVVSYVVIHVPEKRAANIRRMTTDLPCWLSGEHLPIMTPKPVAWVPRCVILWLGIFIIGNIFWQYQIQGVAYDLRPWHRYDQNSYDGCSWIAGHKKNLSFILVKVRYSHFLLLGLRS